MKGAYATALAAILVVVALCDGRADGGDPAAGAGARERVLAAAVRLVGTTEATGRNDGDAIDRILGSVGLAGTGNPYCAAYNRYCYDLAGLRGVGPRSAWSPDWVQAPTWTRAAGGAVPLPADAWGIYFPSKGRVAHTGLVRRWGQSVVVTLEGNTSPEAGSGTEADRNGDGVWCKRRLVRQIYSVRDWIGAMK